MLSKLAIRSAVVALLIGCVGGCAESSSGDTESTSAGTVSRDVLTVGSDLTYPPYAYFQDGDPSGFDVEVTKALADEMGLDATYLDTRFEQLIPGLSAGQLDIVASALYITPERARAVDYVPYFNAGSSIVARANGPRPASEIDLCGLTVGIIRGANAVPIIENELNPKCRDRGEEPVDLRMFPTDPETTQALGAGNVDAQVSDGGRAQDIVDNSAGRHVISSSKLLYPSPAGLAVAKGNADLRSAVEDALGALRESGEYAKLLERFNLEPVDPKLVDEVLAEADAGESGDPAFSWSYLVSLLDDADFWKASLTVVELSVLAWVLAGFLGLLIAAARQSRRRWLTVPTSTYVWFFRSLPLLVLIIAVYNLPQLIPESRPMLSNVFIAGLLALVLSESAYMSEIHRGGLLAVGPDQHEAGAALGLGKLRVFAHIVIPQAFRVAIPALGNEFVTIVKLTSLLSAISLAEILLVAQRLYTQNFKVLETLVAAAVFYVGIVTVFDRLRAMIERRLDVRLRRSDVVTPSEPDVSSGSWPPGRRERRPHTGEAVVEAKGITKSYGGTEVLRQVDLKVHRGEVVAVIGPSGSGKTTLIRAINQLESIDNGSVVVDGKAATPQRGNRPTRRGRETLRLRREVGMVFQRFNLFPHMTALRNVTFAPVATGQLKRSEAHEAGHERLRKVGLEDHSAKYPHQLSGGQQQRVAIARALAMDPSVILFDEPTSALDPELVGEVLHVITGLAIEGRTMVVVTHEMRFARDVADWVVFMADGKVIEEGQPEDLFDRPRQARTRQFLAQIEPAAEVTSR